MGQGGAQLRRVFAVPALVVGLALVWMSWGSLGHLFGGYQDSPLLTYVVFGLVFFVPGAALVAWSGRQLLCLRR